MNVQDALLKLENDIAKCAKAGARLSNATIDTLKVVESVAEENAKLRADLNRLWAFTSFIAGVVAFLFCKVML